MCNCGGKRGSRKSHSRLVKKKIIQPIADVGVMMYEIRQTNGHVVATNQQLTHVIAEAERQLKEDAELWQDGKYIALLVWAGSYFRIEYTGD